MKRLIKIVAILAILLIATGTSALALSFLQVGGYDLYKAASSDNMSAAQEEQWIADQYGLTIDDIEYTKWDASDVTWTNVDDTTGPNTTAIYFDFRTPVSPEEGSLPDEDPFAFLIKAKSGDSLSFNDGVNGPVTGSSFLFSNLDLTQYGVLDLLWFTVVGPDTSQSVFTIETISHTSVGYGGDIPPNLIPEPSTFVLLFAGLLGLAAYRRKKS
jgi:hypothetical protein